MQPLRLPRSLQRLPSSICLRSLPLKLVEAMAGASREREHEECNDGDCRDERPSAMQCDHSAIASRRRWRMSSDCRRISSVRIAQSSICLKTALPSAR